MTKTDTRPPTNSVENVKGLDTCPKCNTGVGLRCLSTSGKFNARIHAKRVPTPNIPPVVTQANKLASIANHAKQDLDAVATLVKSPPTPKLSWEEEDRLVGRLIDGCRIARRIGLSENELVARLARWIIRLGGAEVLDGSPI